MEEKKWTDLEMVKYATEFFYHWWNSPGNNTDQGCKEWFPVWKDKQVKCTDAQIQEKIAEATTQLVKMGVERVYISKTTALTFLALCDIKPDTKWTEATRNSMKMSKDIIPFAVENYNLKQMTNNRDSVRREGINILLNHGVIDLNPDNQLLGPNSPLTHYSIKQRVIKKLQNQ